MASMAGCREQPVMVFSLIIQPPTNHTLTSARQTTHSTQLPTGDPTSEWNPTQTLSSDPSIDPTNIPTTLDSAIVVSVIESDDKSYCWPQQPSRTPTKQPSRIPTASPSTYGRYALRLTTFPDVQRPQTCPLLLPRASTFAPFRVCVQTRILSSTFKSALRSRCIR